MGCCSLNNVTSLKNKQNATTVRVQLKKCECTDTLICTFCQQICIFTTQPQVNRTIIALKVLFRPSLNSNYLSNLNLNYGTLATSFSKSHEKNISALAQCHGLFKRPIKTKSKVFGHRESSKKGPNVF